LAPEFVFCLGMVYFFQKFGTANIDMVSTYPNWILALKSNLHFFISTLYFLFKSAVHKIRKSSAREGEGIFYWNRD
jgi:hypothetical protein